VTVISDLQLQIGYDRSEDPLRWSSDWRGGRRLWIASWAMRNSSRCALGGKLFSDMLSDRKLQRNQPATLERSTKR
jgi:hypothetical protein